MNKTADDLKEINAEGEVAMLIPLVKSLEIKATSIILSCLSSVKEFAEQVLNPIGVSAGVRSKISVYTEVRFQNKFDKINLRPDGLIVVRNGKKVWRALIESKIGSNQIEESQVRDYITIAKKSKVDAIITISNEYASLPHHHPLLSNFKKNELKSIGLYHWSWMNLVTEANHLIKQDNIEDDDQYYLLKEMVRYFIHKDSGASEFDSMNAEWPEIITAVKNDQKLLKSCEKVRNTVVAWHQESRDMCLDITKNTDVPIPAFLKLSRAHINDPVKRIEDDIDQLVQNYSLTSHLDIPNTASELKVNVNISKRTISYSMSVDAPSDKKRNSAKLNWLLRQLKGIKTENIMIEGVTFGKTENRLCFLSDILEDERNILGDSEKDYTFTAFNILMNIGIGAKFSSRKGFILDLEKNLLEFYKNIGENLKQPVAEPPKVIAT